MKVCFVFLAASVIRGVETGQHQCSAVDDISDFYTGHEKPVFLVRLFTCPASTIDKPTPKAGGLLWQQISRLQSGSSFCQSSC